MGSDWQELPLEDCMEALIDYRGKTPKKTTSGIPLITAKIIKKGRIQPVSEFISENDYNNWMRRGIPNEGDVVLTTEAPLGEVAQLDGRKIALAQRVITLRGKKDLLDNCFLKYLIISEYVQHQLDGRGTGTTVKGIKQSELRKVLLKFPQLPEQKAIAHTLGSLDDKIELNRQMNETLEAMAQALFKSWFVDFDPVIDNALAAGNPIPEVFAERAKQRPFDKLKASETASSLKTEAGCNDTISVHPEPVEGFPDAFEYTEEMGWIPEGWEVSNAGTEYNTVGGATPSTKNTDFWEDGDISWTTPKDLSGNQSKILLNTDRKITEIGLSKISSGLLPVDTVLMSSRAPVGYLALAKVPVAINQGYIALKCEKVLTPEFAIQWADSIMDEIKQRAGGTTFAEISKKNFREIPVFVPDQIIINKYSENVKDLYNQITSRIENIETLSKLRDTLLPKLLSGELRIPDAEKLMAEA